MAMHPQRYLMVKKKTGFLML